MKVGVATFANLLNGSRSVMDYTPDLGGCYMFKLFFILMLFSSCDKQQACFTCTAEYYQNDKLVGSNIINICDQILPKSEVLVNIPDKGIVTQKTKCR